ncbi:Tim44 domain-containing protein [Methylocaldum sp.]|uniref:Tim44 domain-containing protein n=1 Tax=Methylocaldum sp. TaxID=1969727 RepID=UPI002D292B76|nr:TIM44-like domain-containing protein [Methylocaldum sp.]HYE35587.1 TIM44-like domain-containing protein [Methylocaldum sp.]
MKKLTGLVLSVLIGFSLALAGTGDAYAKRMGGGKSFGSRPSYSEPYKRSTDMTQSASPAQQQAYQSSTQRNQAARESMSRRGGFMGMLGGLALGGLLGALLFGGAFEHLNFLDILMFAVIAFMLFKFFAARRRAASGETAATANGYYPAGNSAQDTEVDRPYERQAEPEHAGKAGFNTDVLFGKGSRSPVSGQSASVTGRENSVPADFDSAAFLSGAKAAYEMMQKAWDERDLAQLRTLTTDKVFGELQDQLKSLETESNTTELLKIEVELLEVRDLGTDREATVLFDVIMRESPEDRPTQVREVWHFVRPKLSRQPTWFLDGIQQLED